MRKIYVIAKLLLALSPLLICLNAAEPPGGCATTSGTVTPRKLTVALPAAPAFLAPIAKPKVVEGDDARVAYRRSDAALDTANTRLVQSAAWYKGVRKRYGGGK